MSGEARIEARECRLGVVILCWIDLLSNNTLGHSDGEVARNGGYVKSDPQHDAVRNINTDSVLSFEDSRCHSDWLGKICQGPDLGALAPPCKILHDVLCVTLILIHYRPLTL